MKPGTLQIGAVGTINNDSCQKITDEVKNKKRMLEFSSVRLLLMVVIIMHVTICGFGFAKFC